MRENKVTNILFIVFTVMALAGTASLVKTAIAPKENMQETEQKVIPEKPTGEPVPAQAGNDKKKDTADKKKQQPSDKQGKNDPDAAVQKKPEGKNPADSNGQGEPVNRRTRIREHQVMKQQRQMVRKQTMMKARIMSQMMVILRIHK